jgi:hypothetical protein
MPAVSAYSFLADAAGFPLLRLFFLKDLFDNGVGLVHPI